MPTHLAQVLKPNLKAKKNLDTFAGRDHRGTYKRGGDSKRMHQTVCTYELSLVEILATKTSSVERHTASQE